MLRFPKRTTQVMAVAAVSVLALSACGRGGGEESSSPGITDDTVTLGVSNPLSGPVAGPGGCLTDGVIAYFEARNADGGIEFGDGQTRQVEVKALDDTYDPQKAKSNYDQLHKDSFVLGLGLGTPTNRAWRDAAIEDGVPQVLTATGDPLFSDRDESPLQIDAFPTYVSEGEAFGEMLVENDEEYKVAVLRQNDDYGMDYLTGLEQSIEASDKVEIVEELTYEVTDDSIDSQITVLADSGANVLFNAVSQPHLTIAALQKAQDLGWDPIWFLPSNTSSAQAILEPGDASNFEEIYTASYQKDPANPAYAQDEDVIAFQDALEEYTDQSPEPEFPHCMWGYMSGAILEEAFANTDEPTRESFMEAMFSIEGFHPPLGLDDTVVDTTLDGQPAISTVTLEIYDGSGYTAID